MSNLTPEGRRLVAEIASRNGLSLDAALTLLGALQAGYGNQAQFNHPDLGGMGQWSQGGMIMIGDMFNNDLKYRIGNVCNELAGLVRSQPAASFQSQSQSGGGVSLYAAGSQGGGWPAELGSPASAGAQNDMAYAYFPATRRLAIRQGAETKVYDSGEHQISGFAQAQSGDQTLTFTSQFGLVRVADLRLVAPLGDETAAAARSAPDAAGQTPPHRFNPPAEPTPAPLWAPGAQISGDAIFAAIERLAELHKKTILSDEEFAAKKRELLSRL